MNPDIYRNAVNQPGLTANVVFVRVCMYTYSPCKGPGMLVLLKRCLSGLVSSSLNRNTQRSKDAPMKYTVLHSCAPFLKI